MVPKRIFLTNGVGKHKERLTSFELALRDAGIAAQNLVRVSSIFPPHCKLISRKEGVKYLHPGEVTLGNRIGSPPPALAWPCPLTAAPTAT
jgi:arginine decarboxylase